MKNLFLILSLSILACVLPGTLPVSPQAKAPILAADSASATPPVSGIIVVGSVNVRNTPDASGAESWVVGRLESGDRILQLGECVEIGAAVWVRHAGGWTVARNGSGVFVEGVCGDIK